MHLVLERRIAIRRDQPGVVGDGFAERLDPSMITLCEIGPHVAVHQVLDAGMADPEPHAPVVVADVRRYRTQAVVACDPASNLHAKLRRRQLKLVLKHGNLVCRELEEVRSLLNGAAGIVHEGQWTKQDYPLLIERAFRGLALKAAAP